MPAEPHDQRIPSHHVLVRDDASRRSRRLLTLPARVLPPAFLPCAAALSAANRSALRAWGWTPLDHHGVPWPSSLALLPGGRLQALNFAGSGASLVLLAAALPRGPRPVLLAVCGGGLLAAGAPLDPPAGDPGDVRSWIRSWHAAVHTGGFLVAGASGILAVAASRQRADVVRATALAAAATLGRTPGWYAFVGGFFAWVAGLAAQAAREAAAPAER